MTLETMRNINNGIKPDVNVACVDAGSMVDLNFNLKSLLESHTHENKYELDIFLNLIKQNQSKREYVVKFLEQLKQCVDLLDPLKFESNLIQLLFVEVKWHTHYAQDERVLELLREFLIDLNSAYTNYVYKCLTMLVRQCFLQPEPTMQDMAHNLISHLFKIAPSSKTQIVKIIEQSYPYMTKETPVQYAFIHNVLRLAGQFPELRLMLLEICIQKMLKLDVNSTREQIIDADVEADDETANSSMKHPLADRLDVKMACLFEFVKTNCTDPATNEFNWDKCKSIYKDLLYTFDKYVLFTYGSSHVQFIMFYVCSFKTILSEGYLDYLWKKFTAVGSNAITRQICSYYMGSYLSRARYVPLQTCVATLQLMIKWIHGYMDKYSNTSADPSTGYFDMHRTFYCMCQTVFYVVIFRNRQLFADTTPKKLVDLVKSWRLNDIVSCRLNPLKYCLPSIRDKFAKIAYLHQIAYCYSIIDANNRTCIPVSGQSKSKHATPTHLHASKMGESVSGENPLDSFFPFDPYLLKRSKLYVQDFYVEFSQVADVEMDEDDDEEDEEDETDDDEEDEDTDQEGRKHEDEEMDDDDDDHETDGSANH